MFARKPNEQRLQDAFDDELVERPLDGDRPSPHDGSALGDGLDQTVVQFLRFGVLPVEVGWPVLKRVQGGFGESAERVAHCVHLPIPQGLHRFLGGIGFRPVGLRIEKTAIAAFSMRSSGTESSSEHDDFVVGMPRAIVAQVA